MRFLVVDNGENQRFLTWARRRSQRENKNRVTVENVFEIAEKEEQQQAESQSESEEDSEEESVGDDDENAEEPIKNSDML